MFEDAQKQSIQAPNGGKQDSPVSDFVIHVMPASFKEKKTVAKEEKKPVVPPPIAKPVAKPVVAVAPGTKKSSRLPWIIGIIGIFLIASLTIVGIYAVKSLQKEPEIIVVQPEAQEPVVPVVEEEVVAGKDLDSDGLTDIEETMYGTNPRDPDTDRDTYLDGNEVFHRYSPLGVSPQTLLDTGAVKEYLSADGTYSLTYPTQWTVAGIVDSTFEQTQEVVFRTNSNATVRLNFGNLSGATFDDWYAQNAIDGRTVQLETTLTKQGYVAYQSPDDLVAYVINGDVVYIFLYDLADEKEIVYMQTFQMMINSFSVLK